MIGGGNFTSKTTIFGSSNWYYDAFTDEYVVTMPDGSIRKIAGGQVANNPYANALQTQSVAHANQLAQAQMQAQQQLAQQQMQMRAMQNWQPHISASSFVGFATTSSAMPSGAQSQTLLKPDPQQPDTLGWREWVWDDAGSCLKSPSQQTEWPEAELVVPNWDEGAAVRGVSGIHAHLVPRHWKIMGGLHTEYAHGPTRVHGIVERFGKYVLGTEGWRAEWVIIKELMAPSTKIGLKIEARYPDVIVHYPEDEGEKPCISVTSSKLGKGSRSTSRPRPSPSFSPPLPPGTIVPFGPPPNSSPASQQLTQISASHNSIPTITISRPMRSQIANSSPSNPPGEKPRGLRPSLNDICAALTVLGFFVWLVWACS